MRASAFKVAIVLGTRPEFIKFFSVIRALERQKVDFFIVHTGQHYSENLEAVFFKELGLPAPHYRLSIADLTPSEQIGRMTTELQGIFKQEGPSVVLVQGDTNTVMAGTLAGSKLQIPVGNVEAGLRSNNFSMAEEKNRILANQLATYLFAPTPEAYENLRREGFDEHKIYMTGNTIADAVEHFAPLSDKRSRMLEILKLKKHGYFLATIHRAEATDSRENLGNVVAALNALVAEHPYPLVLPLHPRTRKYLEQYGLALDPRIIRIDPLGYFDFLSLLKYARLVLTDSGGIQEEACILRVPTVTVRTETERPETVRVGSNKVVGYRTEDITAGVASMLSASLTYEQPYGEHCGEMIVEIVKGNRALGHRKRILIVSDTYLPLVGGAELYTYNFARHLLNFDYSVTIVANTPAGADKESSGGNPQVIRMPWPGLRHPFAMLRLMRQLMHLTREHDLVFANYTYRMSTLTAVAALLSRKPLFILAHGLGTIIDTGFPRIYYVYRYLSLKLSRGAIATSTEIADIARRFTPHVIVATAVDFPAIDRLIDHTDTRSFRARFPGRKILLTVRRLVPKNGIQFLIKTLPELRKRRDDFVYVALGSGRLEPYLHEMVQKLDLSDHVVFEGEIGNSRVFSYMQGADVVVFPSSAEAMSLACIEAMYLKRPIVATAVGGLVELVGQKEERGYLVDLFGRSESVYSAPDVDSIPEERYKAFAGKIDAALAAGGTGAKVSAAKAFVEHEFNWSTVTNRIMEFVQDRLTERV